MNVLIDALCTFVLLNRQRQFGQKGQHTKAKLGALLLHRGSVQPVRIQTCQHHHKHHLQTGQSHGHKTRLKSHGLHTSHNCILYLLCRLIR